MQIEQIRHFNQLTTAFYKEVSGSFSQTRQQAWQGWKMTLPFLPKQHFSLLDIGCGNGRFGSFLHSEDENFSYVGIDNNENLLKEAQYKNYRGKFLHQDIVELFLSEKPLPKADVIVCFGVLHHIPSQELRAKCIKAMAEALNPNGILILTTWQFLRLPKLLERQKFDTNLEKNDHLLTWSQNQNVVRFCHFTSDEEIHQISASLPLKLLTSFSADGYDKLTNHYFIWRKTSAGNL